MVKQYNEIINGLVLWAQRRILGLFAFNILVMLLIVLRSAGYFDPFFLITINLVVFLSFIMSIFLLGAGSRVMFIIAFVFWILAAALKALHIDVWAERTAVYIFQALILGLVLFIIEIVRSKSKV